MDRAAEAKKKKLGIILSTPARRPSFGESTGRGSRQGSRRGGRGTMGEMIKNAVASLMVRLHHLSLPRAAPAATYRRRHHHHHALRLPRPASASVCPAAAMSTTAEQAVADQKRALRTEVRRALKALTPDQRASEGDLRRACLVSFGSCYAIAGPMVTTHYLFVNLPIRSRK
jgi:hypothetical protein